MKPGIKNSYKSLSDLNINGKNYKIYSLLKAESNGLNGISKLPKSLKVLLENLLRYEDDVTVTKKQIEAEKKGYPIFTINEENLHLKKGFNLLPQPSECDLFFDIESVQDHVFSGKLEYLFGVFYEENGKKIFKPFWAHNRNLIVFWAICIRFF